MSLWWEEVPTIAQSLVSSLIHQQTKAQTSAGHSRNNSRILLFCLVIMNDENHAIQLFLVWVSLEKLPDPADSNRHRLIKRVLVNSRTDTTQRHRLDSIHIRPEHQLKIEIR